MDPSCRLVVFGCNLLTAATVWGGSVPYTVQRMMFRLEEENRAVREAARVVRRREMKREAMLAAKALTSFATKKKSVF